MQWKRPALRNSVTLLWDITDHCNLRCKHCYNGHKYFSHCSTHAPSSSDPLWEPEMLLVESISSEHIDFVHFLGGEPLVSPKLFSVAARLREKRIRMGLNTNGTLVRDKIKNIQEADFDQIVVSLDSPHAEINDLVRGKGVHKKVIRGLNAVSNLASTKVVISWTLTRVSILQPGEVEAMVALCKHYNIHTLSVNWLFDDGFALSNETLLQYDFAEAFPFIEQLAQAASASGLRLQIDARPRLIDYLNKKFSLAITLTPEAASCKGSRSHFMLRYNGDLFPCAPLDGPHGAKFLRERRVTFQPPNLTKTPIGDAIESDSFLLWKEVTAPPLLKPRNKVCNTCHFQDICQPCPLEFAEAAPVECQHLHSIQRAD